MNYGKGQEIGHFVLQSECQWAASAEIFIVNKFLWPMAKVMACHVKGFLNDIHGCTGVTCTVVGVLSVCQLMTSHIVNVHIQWSDDPMKLSTSKYSCSIELQIDKILMSLVNLYQLYIWRFSHGWCTHAKGSYYCSQDFLTAVRTSLHFVRMLFSLLFTMLFSSLTQPMDCEHQVEFQHQNVLFKSISIRSNQ